MGSIHGLSCGLLVRGNANLPYGVVPGVGPDRLKMLAEGGKIGEKVAPLSETFLGPLVNDIAPNLAKVDGPFHLRLPYIARFATTFEWIIPLEIPYICPQEIPNFHVPIMRGLSTLFGPTLNFEIGDNLLSHTDWWGEGGEGRAPILGKPAAVELVRENGQSVLSLGPNKSKVERAVTERAHLVGSEQVENYANNLIFRLMALWTEMIEKSTPIPLISWGDVISKGIDGIADKFYDVEEREEDLEKQVPKECEELERSMTKFWHMVDKAEGRATTNAGKMAQECSGALVYAGGDLTVGSIHQGVRDPLSAGFFLAQGKVRLESEVTIGAACSLQDTVHGEKLLYYPAFTVASIPAARPMVGGGDWKTRGLFTTYGSQYETTAQPVGLWRARLSSEIRGSL